MKMQKSTRPKFEISIFEKFGFGKMENQNTKIKILNFLQIIFKEFGFAKSKKSAPQNPKSDYDFDFLGPKFNFEKFQNRFLLNSSRISIRDPKI